MFIRLAESTAIIRKDEHERHFKQTRKYADIKSRAALIKQVIDHSNLPNLQMNPLRTSNSQTSIGKRSMGKLPPIDFKSPRKSAHLDSVKTNRVYKKKRSVMESPDNQTLDVVDQLNTTEIRKITPVDDLDTDN